MQKRFPRSMHPITLRFSDDALEASLQQRAAEDRTVYLVFAVAVGVVGLLTGLRSEQQVTADQEHTMAAVRMGHTGCAAFVWSTWVMRDKVRAWKLQQVAVTVTFAAVSLVTFLTACPRPESSLEDAVPANVVQAAGRSAALLLIIVGTHFLYVHINVKMVVAVLPVVTHAFTPVWAVGPIEGIMFAMASAIGVLIGYLLERSRRNSFLQETLTAQARREQLEGEHRDQQRRFERKAHRVLNHVRPWLSAVRQLRLLPRSEHRAGARARAGSERHRQPSVSCRTRRSRAAWPSTSWTLSMKLLQKRSRTPWGQRLD